MIAGPHSAEGRLLVAGGTVVDGTGAAPSRQDILVEDGRVAAVGLRLDVAPDVPRLDVRGREILPGFVDVHTHDDLAVLTASGCEPKLRQGVTTSIVGNCGQGCAPSTPKGDLERYAAPVLGGEPTSRRWPLFADYLTETASAARTVNIAALVAHAPLRVATMGIDARPASPDEVADMCGALDDALSAGAVGLSLGLLYAPGSAADVTELRALAAVVARHGAVLVAHVRNEADDVVASIDEIADLGRISGAAVQISHLKVTSRRNYGRMPQVIDRLEEHRAGGVDVMVDVYPYDAGSTTSSTLLPAWAVAGGPASVRQAITDPVLRRRLRSELSRRWTAPAPENFLESTGPSGLLLAGFGRFEHRALEGTSLADIAAARGSDPVDCFIDLLAEEDRPLTVVIFHTDPEGVRQALSWPHALVGSDGLPHAHGYVHPRLYGAFGRVLAELSGPGRLLSREDAVHRMSGASARRFGLTGRGTLTVGAAADLVVVDPVRLRDRATYARPRRHPDGVELVLVNGEPACREHVDRTTAVGMLLRPRRLGAEDRPSGGARPSD